MKTYKIFFLAIVFPLLSFTTWHKYYVSVTEVEYVEEKKTIQIISRIFIDDFEKLLRERYDKDITLAIEDDLEKLLRVRYDKDITLAIEDEKPSINFYIEKYLKEKLKLKINNQEVEFKFLGKEYEDDIMISYLEIENIHHISSIQVINIILFDVFLDQQNIVRFKINSKNKSFLLTKENDKGMLKF